MKIPEIREELLGLAEELFQEEFEDSVQGDIIYSIADRIVELEKELWRRKPVRRAPPKPQMPASTRRPLVQAYAAAHPDANYQEIADAIEVPHTLNRPNQGRVSEDLAGFRE